MSYAIFVIISSLPTIQLILDVFKPGFLQPFISTKSTYVSIMIAEVYQDIWLTRKLVNNKLFNNQLVNSVFTNWSTITV